MSNNKHFDKLAELVQERFGIDQEQLIDALFIIRAHYNLAGIVLVCRRLNDLTETHLELKNGTSFEDLNDRLSTLIKISQLDDAPGHFLEETINKNKRNETPLRPSTGDSSLCDLLLIEHGNRDPEHSNLFEWVLAWFTWQTFHFQKKIHSPQKYRDYLLGKGDIKLKKKDGSRINGAFHALRQLGDVNNSENLKTLNQVKHLLSDIDKESSINAATKLEETRKKDTIIENKIRYNLSLFLSQLWFNEKTRSVNRIKRTTSKVKRKQEQLGLRRYGQAFSVLQRIDADNIHSGLIVEINRQSTEDNKSEELLTGVNDLNDDPTELSVEPEVLLFLSDGNDLLRGFYASKSALHHIESGNAGLLWPRWRLSNTAISQLLSSIEFIANDSPMRHRAKLAIGLSLLTGRSLSEVSAPVFVESDDTSELANKIWINTSSMVLMVPAGTPELKNVTPLPKFCSSWASFIRLPLPDFMHFLVKEVATYVTTTKQETVKNNAIKILDKLAKHYEVTPKSIQNALKLTLQDKSKGDLAVIKAITNASGLNYDNLIHYASFNRESIEELWRACIESWKIQIPTLNLTTILGERVGSPFGIEINKVAAAIQEIKTLFEVAIKEKNENDALTLLTLYTVLWLNLATAGRRARNPFPEFISQDGWALIRDKHRKDESTDRYLPLSIGVRNQIDFLRSRMKALSINSIDFSEAIKHSTYLLDPKVFSKENKITNFTPSIMGKLEFVSDLPGNWGRKLVRSEQNSLSGRFKDAGLGHWVRGRHPWTHTCSFPPTLFKQEWLAMQNRLEQELGFELLDTTELVNLTTPQYSLPKTIKEDDSNTTEPYTPKWIIDKLSNKKFLEYKEATLESEAPSGQVALELGQLLLGDIAKDDSIDLRAAAESYCALMRQEKGIPIYAQSPRSQFQKNWMVSQSAFSSWCYIEQQLLETIKKDLSKLPAVEIELNIEIAIGRLLVAASLYGGVNKSNHLDSLMSFLSSKRPIHAIGEARAIELQVPCDRSKSKIRRTILLTPYLSSLFLIERERVKPTLARITQMKPSSHYNQWNKCFRAYQTFLGLSNQLSISQWLEALQQNLLLTASPLLAAYSAGEVLSEDLPISELQRLSGYQVIKPAEILLKEKDAEIGLKIDDKENGLMVDDNENGLMVEGTILPEIIQQIRTLRSNPESNIAEWETLFFINKNDHKINNAENILKFFGKHMLDEFCAGNVSENPISITTRMQRFFEERLTIVATGLIGFSDISAEGFKFDERSLQHLSELTEGYFSAKKHHGAWNSFRKFLKEFNNFTTGRILEANESRVSAKVFSSLEIIQIIEKLDSRGSGLKPIVRKIAQWHFRLTADTGARRAESENIRNLDVDDNMLRIRPYDGHTLKTAGSARVLPIGILEISIQNHLHKIEGDVNKKVMDGVDGHSTSGDNFFNKVSQLITAVTGDADLGMHHLRHTLASAYALKSLGNTVDLSLLNNDLPWVNEWLPSNQQLSVLLGPEGQCGQGIKVTSAMLGHIHETTTLKHYIHTLFAALYAHYLAQEQPDLHIAFGVRMKSRSNLYLHQAINKEVCQPDEVVREMRNHIEVRLQKIEKKLKRNATNTTIIIHSQKTDINHQQTELNKDEYCFSASAEDRLAQLERIEKYFLNEEGKAPSDIEQWIEALQKLTTIKSGKKGCNNPRHPLPQVGKHGDLPTLLDAGTAYKHAKELLTWLQKLEEKNPKDYRWLINKWLYHSEAEKGLIRLEPNEEKYVEDLFDQASTFGNIRLQISKIKNGYRFQIRIADDNGKTIREAGAVRWVMSWVSIDMLKI